MKVILLLFVSCLAFSNISAQVYVNYNATGTNDGSSWANAHVDLQSAIYYASAGDEIWVSQGTYRPSIDTTGAMPTMPETRSFWLKNGVKVYGGFAGSETLESQRDPFSHKVILEGQMDSVTWAENVLNIYSGTDSTAVLDGFIVQNGKSTVTSTNKSGAGMLLRGNASFYYIDFRNNESYNHGGAVYAEYSSSRFVCCRFEDNSTVQYDGGAGNFVYSDISMYNCVFDGNYATRFGGAITTVESDLDVQNGTFAMNTAGTNIFQFSTSGTINLNNCIFTADNVAPVVLGTSGGSANFRECLMPITTDWTILCPTCFTGDATFTDAASGDFSLMDGSIGIDETLLVTPINNFNDILGNPRLVGSSMDLGAYENDGAVGITVASAVQHSSIYPNPTSSSLSIEIGETINSISIYNSAGVCVQKEGNSTFSVENLSAGLYLLEIRTDKGISTGRFVKE